ncbi:hypothetical protein SBA3_180042 [Candidatus Sulfopaludibacter sp. SbA3]|nr:hypothetical protein SBA3_180042 [Candidatus Sulfopaludibacter sp. SbA3]
MCRWKTNRQDITEGAQQLGVPLEEHIDFCIKAMQERAEVLGLKGTWGATSESAASGSPALQ